MTTNAVPPTVVPGRTTTPTQALIGYAVRFAVCAFFCLALGVALVFVVPRFQETFKDFKVNLPWVTTQILGLSDFVANQFGWILLLFLPALLPAPILLLEICCPPQTARILRRLYTALLVAVLVVFVASMILGIALPHIKLIQNVAGGDRGE
jgi:hypothetical protein